MEKLKTKDGSFTFVSQKFDEPYHSKSGALEEALEKYSNALLIWEINSPVIFDFCFGLGYNTLMAVNVLKSKGLTASFVCFENDVEILKKVLELNIEIGGFDLLKEFVKGVLEDKFVFEKEGFKFEMVLADAIVEIEKDLEKKADYVFFDPFSPKKHPEMWEEKVFKNLNKNMKKEGKLATYSYAKKTRENLEKAGFKVIDGPIIGRRSPSTIAIKK